jgi:signal peptidase I
LAEALIYSNIAGIVNFNRFMDFVGLTIFPALSANVFYHYVSKNYGMLPNIVFRLITTLYIYFIPTITAMEESIDSCIRIIVPIAMLALVSAMFEKKKRNAVRRSEKLGIVGMVLTVAIIVSVAMLISCQFRFGALVIATDSMTGEINKGDMIIYERYDDQKIEEGQVIVFLEDDRRIIHRVVGIETVGEEVRYITKGDANEDNDSGYRVRSDIIGLTDVKLAFVGYPTLWLRELLSRN